MPDMVVGMSGFTFLHAADLHLDTPFAGLSRGAEEVGQALRDASLDAYDRLIRLALEERVAFVLFAGDIYDGAFRGLRAQLHFLRGMERLSEAGIPSFVVHGNHDPLEEGWSAIRRWPAGVHVFGWEGVERVPVLREGVHLATIHGQSYERRAEQRNLARGFAPVPGEGALQVGLLHANVGGQPGHDDYAPCSLADLREAGMDYWALGHVHTRQILLQGEVWAVYPGNLQGRSFKPSERGSKGASLVHVESGRVVGVEHRALAPVRFEVLRLNVEAHEDIPAIQRTLLEEAERLRDPAMEGLVLSAELVGRTALHGDLLREVEELREALAGETRGARGWTHWASLDVHTAPAVDLAALRDRRDLLGTLLRRLGALREDEEGLRTLLREVELPLAGLLGREIEEGDALAGLLDEVEAEALRELLEEG